MLGFNLRWVAGVDGAGAAGNSGDGRVSISGVVAVQPEHVGVVVVPDAENKGHALVESIAHTSQTAMGVEDVDVIEDILLRVAELGGDGVSGIPGNGGLGVGDDFAVLDVETLDLREGASVGSVVGQELSDQCERRVGIDNLARAIERVIALTEGVKVTSVRVAGAAISVAAVGSTTGVSGAHGLSGLIARVGSERRGDAVGFPDIHFSTAGAVVANATIRIRVRRLPAFDVGLFKY